MKYSLLVWLIPTLSLVAGVAIGLLVARMIPNAPPKLTHRHLYDLQKRFDSYQNEVIAHFNRTAILVKNLTQSYQEVQYHIEDGANHLTLDDISRQHLLDALHSDKARIPREGLPPPRDYVPETPNSPVMTNNHYGLKK